MLRILMLLAIASGLTAEAVFARQDIRVERVQFERGKSSAHIESSITGYATVDYVLGARKGQYMNVSMTTDNGANYFNILAPGEDQVALFNGSINENQYEGVLPETGDYKVRVYLMRSAARRNEVANYRLEMIITTAEQTGNTAENGQTGTDSATRAGKGDFDATGQIPCAQDKGQPTTACDFGVSREGGGTAAVVITQADDRQRIIFFIDGRASSADTSQADGNGEFKVKRESDLNLIRVGDERYEIPDAVIFGG